MIFEEVKSSIQFLTEKNGYEIYMLREDEIHPVISGNKFRKFKYNLIEFQKGNYEAILTFGGAYSNHIHATAAAGKEFGIRTIGIIRGEELSQKISDNPTLDFAQNCGMELHFISRENYRKKAEIQFQNDLKTQLGNIYILPEGGTNEAAIRGCEEILSEQTKDFDLICCPVGTGGTISGLINSSENHQRILGFPVLKNAEFLRDEIKNFAKKSNWDLDYAYHFGGYAKTDDKLLDFINKFKSRFGITLDPIYTGKMMFGIFERIEKIDFPERTKRILAIHTGGLQGISGINQQLKSKNKVIIE